MATFSVRKCSHLAYYRVPFVGSFPFFYNDDEDDDDSRIFAATYRMAMLAKKEKWKGGRSDNKYMLIYIVIYRVTITNKTYRNSVFYRIFS